MFYSKIILSLCRPLIFGNLPADAGALVMWAQKQNTKSNLTRGLYLTIQLLVAAVAFGCSGHKSFYDVNRDKIDEVPTVLENPENPILDIEEPNKEPKKPKPESSADRPTTPPKPAPSPLKPESTTEASRFIKVSFWVVQNEARKIGTPCNFYVSRVLELSGYSDDGFLANDFDLYARKHFSSYKDERFVTQNLESERRRLKRYIWSYPARTPFILQWERPRPKPGHIAIVERIGDQLVVYQASLNRHIARREQTSIDILLSPTRGANLTVYSEFVASK